ncbi:MAG TPA: hypothetical protein VH479_13335 [Acidimicrobiales bacterium]
MVVAEGLAAYPSASFDDWASYADAVVIVHIDSERAEPADEDRRRGEGLVPRTVTATASEVVWTYPGGPGTPDGPFEFLTAGWILHDGREHPMRYAGGARLEVGSSYLMPIFQDRATREWAALSTTAAFPVDGERAVTAAAESGGPDVGMTPSAVATAMEGATPEAVAMEHRELSPRDRYLAVVADSPGGDG